MYLKLCSWWADLDMKSKSSVWTFICTQFILSLLWAYQSTDLDRACALEVLHWSVRSDWKRGGFCKADGSLWSVTTVLFVWVGHAPQSNVPPFPNVKGWDICVRKCEYALKYSLLFTTTPYHIPFPSSGQIYLAGFQLSLPALLKMPQGAKNIILKNIFVGQGWHCCQCWGSYLLLIKATALWIVDLGPVTILAVWAQWNRLAVANRIGEDGSDSGLYSIWSKP